MRDPKHKAARAHRPRRFHLLDKLRKRYRWLLWLALLSAYLFLPALRSLRRSSSSSSSDPRSGVRIYAYDLPPRFNRGWVEADARCARHLFAAEVAVHQALLLRQRRAGLRPEEADLFFVPVYVSCNFSTPTGLPSLAHARGMLAEAVDFVRAEMPYWNRSGGADHVFVASHDFGACFHPMEDVAIAAGIPEFLKRSILLQTFGVQGRHACQEVEHVVIPPHVPPEVSLELPEPEKVHRDIFAFFRGKMEVRPKNISGHFYSK